MNIEIIAHTLVPEQVVSAAAKLCYSPSGATSLLEDLNEEKVEGFIGRLMDLGHESPLEHVSFTFAIEGVSRVLTHQLVRHRMASYSQQSQRYVKFDQFDYILPPAIEQNEAARVLFQKAMEEDQKTYDQLCKLLKADHVKKLLQEGKNEREANRLAEKAAIEDARYVFPNGAETKIVMTMNGRSLLNFFSHRTCERAQWEIRNMAMEMIRLVKGLAPNLFKDAGPPCLGGPCPEGKMTCGRRIEVRKKFEEI